MVLKGLKLHQFFNSLARTFSSSEAWVSERRKEFENFGKNVIFLVSSGKNQI